MKSVSSERKVSLNSKVRRESTSSRHRSHRHEKHAHTHRPRSVSVASAHVSDDVFGEQEDDQRKELLPKQTLPVLQRTSMLLANRQASNPEPVERPRRMKHKSIIHLGPSRQQVLEHYLVDPEVEQEEKEEEAPLPIPSPVKRARDKRVPLRRRLSSIKQDIVESYLQTVASSEFEAENQLERRNSYEELQRSLSKSGFRGLDVLLEDDDREPIQKFKRCAENIIWMQRFVGAGRDKQQHDVKDWKFLSWTLVYDDLGLTKRSYADLGLSFDPKEFRLKRQNHISSEAKEILCMNPADRTKEQLHIAQLSLDQTVEQFSEFPIKMQESLVKTGWYEEFEAGRVIIRQGHTADNFYMILSGTAVVTILERSKTGEEAIYTANILEKGYCFGELALIHQAKRSATVTCRDDVELLAVGREDFLDIFMKTERGKEPEHITFLKKLHIIRDWPVEQIPLNNPKICIFIYVRRDCVLCKDSNQADWVYVIMTGTCRVLKNLNDTKPTLTRTGHQAVISPRTRQGTPPPRTDSPAPASRASTPGTTPQPTPRQRRVGVVNLKPAHFERSRQSEVDIQITSPTPESTQRQVKIQRSPRSPHLEKLDKVHDKLHPRLRRSQHKRMLDAVFDERKILPPVDHEPTREPSRIRTRLLTDDGESQPQVFIEVAKLGPGDIFGLEQVVMAGIKDTTNCSLVSDGAECILINKKFFRKHLSEDVAKRIRMEIQPFPTEEALQRKLQTQTNWDAFRQITVGQQLAYKRHVQKTMLKYF